MTKPSRHAVGATKDTALSLRGVDASSDNGVVLRFAAKGATFSWEFKAATFDELVALMLGGRLGVGKDVHFDAAKVSFKAGQAGARQGAVRIAIGRKVRIVVPAPVRGKLAALSRKAAGETPVKRVVVKRGAIKRVNARRRTPIA